MDLKGKIVTDDLLSQMDEIGRNAGAFPSKLRIAHIEYEKAKREFLESSKRFQDHLDDFERRLAALMAETKKA